MTRRIQSPVDVSSQGEMSTRNDDMIFRTMLTLLAGNVICPKG